MVVAAGVTSRLVSPGLSVWSGAPGLESTAVPPEKPKASTELPPSVRVGGSALKLVASGPPRGKLRGVEVADLPAALVTVQERVRTPKAAVSKVTVGSLAPAVMVPPSGSRLHW